VHLSENAQGKAELNVEVRDSGAGFNTETAQRAPEPFFSTRNVLGANARLNIAAIGAGG